MTPMNSREMEEREFIVTDMCHCNKNRSNSQHDQNTLHQSRHMKT